eukprot:CAMPEP_0194327524 /NCGR_PEP_ID=MMETSP0171-20130528/41442_1 /TAXON_ID=218684 /ORGANISM="Corethron pennatum, Strain L29A3" /LENGTH=198 /DNA_ID=CAMNT_0039087501 /DNA_START=20 /DNA_END=616 /DNA_ORIENTATION=+
MSSAADAVTFPLEYIPTNNNSFISRHPSTKLYGIRNIDCSRGRVAIHHGCVVRGDLGVPVRFGRYACVQSGCVIRPSADDGAAGPGRTYNPVAIGSHTTIGENCVVEAVSVGSNVEIGARCVIGARSVIRDNCVVETGSILPPDSVVPPFSRVSGRPGRRVGDVQESYAVTGAEKAVERYVRFAREVKRQLNAKAGKK